MPDSTQNISKEKIELEIYNTFELFNKEKNICIAGFLNKLKIHDNENQDYRKIKFTYNSLFRLLIFKKLKKIKYQNQLHRYLKSHPEETLLLGLTNIPDRRTIGYFLHHILNDEQRELIDFIVLKVEEISEKFGILFDVQTLEPERPNKLTKKRNQELQRRKNTKEVCKLIKKRFSPFIDFKLRHNTVYQKNQFIDLMLHMGMTRDFAENGSKTLNELREDKSPNADTLLYHIKNHNDLREIQRMYLTLFEILWEMTKQTNVIDLRKSYDVAIDYTEWFYYGDRSTPMVVGKKPERGTSKCYKFATINIVESGKRFTLLALPVGPFDNKDEILQKLLDYTAKRIKVRRIYADRGFFDSNSIKIFNKFHLKYIMPCTHYSTVKKALDLMSAPSVVKDFEMKNITFNMVIVEDEEGNKRAFATNDGYNENDLNLAERLFYLYSKRWGIETSYRVKKHSFLPKTTSRNYLIRIFYFLFSVLFYNLWLLADILIWMSIFGEVGQDHLVTSKYFGTILYNIDPGG
ncbi:MAG: transposase [Candidatus Thermoplasmatota archaeon]